MDKCGGGRRVVRTHNPPRHLKSSNTKQKGNCLPKTQLLGNRNKPINPNLQNHRHSTHTKLQKSHNTKTGWFEMTLRRKIVPYHHQFRFSFRLVTISNPFPRSQPKLIGHSMWRISNILRNPQFQFRCWCMAWTLGIVEGAKKTGEWFASSSYMLSSSYGPKFSPLSAHWKLQRHRMVRISNFPRGGMCVRARVMATNEGSRRQQQQLFCLVI